MTGSIESFTEGSSRRNSFTSGLASILGIHQRQIHYLSVRSGSIIVELAFMKMATSAVTPDRAIALLKDAFLAGKLDDFGVIDLTVGGQSVYSSSTPYFAIAASSGLVFIVGVLLFRYLRSRFKCNIKVAPVDTDTPQNQTEYSKAAAYQSLHFLSKENTTATEAAVQRSSSTQEPSVQLPFARVRVPHD